MKNLYLILIMSVCVIQAASAMLHMPGKARLEFEHAFDAVESAYEQGRPVTVEMLELLIGGHAPYVDSEAIAKLVRKFRATIVQRAQSAVDNKEASESELKAALGGLHLIQTAEGYPGIRFGGHEIELAQALKNKLKRFAQ